MVQNRNSGSEAMSLYKLGAKILRRNIYFFCFITILGLGYIANSHVAEKKVRKISILKNDLQDLNWEYMNLQSQLMDASKYSNIQTKLNGTDLTLDGRKPKMLIIGEN